MVTAETVLLYLLHVSTQHISQQFLSFQYTGFESLVWHRKNIPQFKILFILSSLFYTSLYECLKEELDFDLSRKWLQGMKEITDIRQKVP